MKFVDEVEIEVRAGDGGNGCVAFRREKYQPRGGPSGGDGGDGGSVVLCADPGVGTLLEFRYSPLIKAPSGQHGKGSDRNGRNGESKKLAVPVGTLAFDKRTGEMIADLDHRGATATVAQGGRGGAGNLRFKKPWNRAPRHAEEGTKGEQRELRLELRLLADVGIIGMPNVGKSTLVSKLSAARPKIADYPFTTLVPNLGVVRVDSVKSYVLADIPGLVPGASSGAGLGSRFLRHVERTECLLHMLAFRPDEESRPFEDYSIINRELEQHNEELAKRPQIVVLNKADVTETRDIFDDLKKKFEEIGIEIHLISAATGEGIEDLRFRMWSMIEDQRRSTSEEFE